MFFVYVLLSKKDKSFYVGKTDDIVRRMKEHKQGKVKSTKHRRPFIILFYEGYFLKKIVSKRERFLKSSDGRKDIRKRFDSFEEGLEESIEI